jgi:hypothetical protein
MEDERVGSERTRGQSKVPANYGGEQNGFSGGAGSALTFVKAYSREVIDVKVSAIPSRM